MSVLSPLTDLVTQVNSRGDSGVVMITGVASGQSSPITFSLRFESGELARASGGQVHGLEAVQELVKLGAISNMRWFPMAASASWNRATVVGAAVLQDFLGGNKAEDRGSSLAQQVQQSEQALAQAKEQERRINKIVDHSYRVFADVYMGDAEKTLAGVAKRYPPQTQPEQYLAECVRLLAPLLGQEAAERLLAI